MSAQTWLQLLILLVLLAISSPLLGIYIYRIFITDKAPGGQSFEDKAFGFIERPIYRLCGVSERSEQRWKNYAVSLLAFSFVSVVVVYAMQRLQGSFPLNPDDMGAVPPPLAFNTAVSFVTNTNWQNYGGESTMAHLTQMAALAVQNFASAAVGLTVAIALMRGLVRSRSRTLGNFWVDLVRGVVRLLVPLAFVFAIVLVSQGVVQNFHHSQTATTLQSATQAIPQGPVASQEAIKELGENGGGFFNANSSHPYENPNGFTNIVEIWLLLAIPFALPFTFGRMARNMRQGAAVLAAMLALWLTSALLAMTLESGGSPNLKALGVDQQITLTQPGGSMEGKDVRLGPGTCGLFAASTTGTSTGAVNCAHDSMTPLGGAVPLVNMMFGEVSPGGTGSGLYGMLIFALLTVFLAGLMVGRTPEYLGKKIQAAEMKLVVLYILFVPAIILCFAGASLVAKVPLASLANDGPHGLTEMTYAFTSASNNNGSAFGGLAGNTTWFNTTLGLCMLIGRFFLIVPALAIAGSLAHKQVAPPSAGTFPTGTPMFACLLVTVVVIVVGLTYFPVIALGPIVEHLQGRF